MFYFAKYPYTLLILDSKSRSFLSERTHEHSCDRTYIIIFLTSYNELISDNENDDLHTALCLRSGPRFSIKMSSYQYRKSHRGDKTILRPSYLHNGISYTGKMTSLYWIGAQVMTSQSVTHYILWYDNCYVGTWKVPSNSLDILILFTVIFPTGRIKRISKQHLINTLPHFINAFRVIESSTWFEIIRIVRWHFFCRWSVF